MPRVTVVISNHNYGRFVGGAIESAIGQTHAECEVIVVDDGSTDDSRIVIGRYADVETIFQENRGQAAAFNAGLARAGGDVVIFLDADDMLAPGIAATVASVFERDADVAKVMYRLSVVDEIGAPTGEQKPPAHLPLRSGDLRREVMRFPFDMTWMATTGNAFRVEALRTLLPIPEDDYPRVGADWYLSHLSALVGTVVFLDDIGGSYRVHSANSYERRSGALDLEQVRQTIIYARRTATHIVETARRLDLAGRPDDAVDILSIAELWQRLASLRLEPEKHPVDGDTRWRLLWLGIRAARGRSDVAPILRVGLGAWVATIALAPAGLVPTLISEMESLRRGGRVTHLLARLHR